MSTVMAQSEVQNKQWRGLLRRTLEQSQLRRASTHGTCSCRRARACVRASQAWHIATAEITHAGPCGSTGRPCGRQTVQTQRTPQPRRATNPSPRASGTAGASLPSTALSTKPWHSRGRLERARPADQDTVVRVAEEIVCLKELGVLCGVVCRDDDWHAVEPLGVGELAPGRGPKLDDGV